MSFGDWLKKKTDDDRFNEDLQARESRTHSYAYHRYFEGYTEVKEEKAGGKGYRIRRVYTGMYYSCSLRSPYPLLLKLGILLLYLLGAAAFASAALEKSEINALWTVALGEAVSVPLMAWTGVTVFLYLVAGKRMTIHEYRSSSRGLIRSSLWASIAVALSAAAVLIPLPGEAAAAPGKWWLFFRLGFAAAAMLAVGRIEARVPYTKTASEWLGKVNGVMIR